MVIMPSEGLLGLMKARQNAKSAKIDLSNQIKPLGNEQPVSKTFKGARLVGVVGGALGIFFTALLLFLVLIPQWLDDPTLVDLDTIVRQTIFIGIPTVTSIFILVYSRRARVESHRANGIAILLSAVPLLLTGIVGYIGVSIVFIYFLPGILATVAALVITFA